MSNVLILYHSRLGSVQQMARLIARGVASIEGCDVVLRTVHGVDESVDAIIQPQDIQNCDGLILGSPTRFGNMSAEMKHFIDGTSREWMNGTLAGKPAAVFTSSSSMHGGQESTLLSMMIPLLHHGMILCGLPYTEPTLSKTTSGGTPYGASHVAGSTNKLPISGDEKTLCLALGKRVARLANTLANQQ